MAVKNECGICSATDNYPREGRAVAKLEKNIPTNTNFDYTIKIINPTNYILSDVVVNEKPADTNLKASSTDAHGVNSAVVLL
jgi:hypothetical protein